MAKRLTQAMRRLEATMKWKLIAGLLAPKFDHPVARSLRLLCALINADAFLQRSCEGVYVSAVNR
jgi:hypothetical protein